MVSSEKGLKIELFSAVLTILSVNFSTVFPKTSLVCPIFSIGITSQLQLLNYRPFEAARNCSHVFCPQNVRTDLFVFIELPVKFGYNGAATSKNYQNFQLL